jgi:hypothetical protein
LLIPDPTIAPSRIPDPGGKKAPDPGSATLLYKLITFSICYTNQLLRTNISNMKSYRRSVSGSEKKVHIRKAGYSVLSLPVYTYGMITGNESDSDLDYDDLDELIVPSDADDFMEDEDGGGDSDSEDDHSVASATTTMSTSSVGSNTPSLVSFFSLINRASQQAVPVPYLNKQDSPTRKCVRL